MDLSKCNEPDTGLPVSSVNLHLQCDEVNLIYHCAGAI